MRRMEAMKRACELLGGISATARLLGVRPPTVHQWVSGARPIPANVAPAIELATEAEVRRWHLRPTDWHRIWPELIGTEGAPNVPAEEVRDAA